MLFLILCGEYVVLYVNIELNVIEVLYKGKPELHSEEV